MALTQPGETDKKNTGTRVEGSPFTAMRLLDCVPLSNGHAASATVSMPGRERRCKATCSHEEGGCACALTVSRVRRPSAENPVGIWDRRSKLARNRPEVKRTTKQNA